MKFIKGVMVGTMISAGVVMMCSESGICMSKKWMKKGKRLMKNMGT